MDNDSIKIDIVPEHEQIAWETLQRLEVRAEARDEAAACLIAMDRPGLNAREREALLRASQRLARWAA